MTTTPPNVTTTPPNVTTTPPNVTTTPPNVTTTPTNSLDTNSVLFFIIITCIGLLFLSVIFLTGGLIEKKTVFIAAIPTILFISIFIILNITDPDEEINRAIKVIFTYYEDVSIITIMQTVLFIIYGVLDWSDRVHEKYLFFMGIFIIGGIRLLLLLLKSSL